MDDLRLATDEFAAWLREAIAECDAQLEAMADESP